MAARRDNRSASGPQLTGLGIRCAGVVLAVEYGSSMPPASTARLVVALAASLAVADICAAQDAAALSRLGTAAIDSHRFGDALNAFTQAAALQPHDAGHCFGAGLAAFMLGQNEVAQARFECALARNPAFRPAALWLGDLHYRAGRLEEAIAVYEDARRRAPVDRQFREQLALWRKERELQSQFRELRSERFRVFFDPARDEESATRALMILESAHRRVGAALGVFPAQPVNVVLYTRAQFRQITGLAGWSAAAYDGRIRVPLDATAADRDDLERVLSHEFVHALVATLAGRAVPAWLNEGLASVLEPTEADGSQNDPPAARVRAALPGLHRSFVGLPRREAEVAYASASMGVRALIERRGAGAVVELLADLGRGSPFATAFHHRIGMRYEDFAAMMALD